MPRKKLTHLDTKGRAVMVDVSAKPATPRRAVARAVVSMKPGVLRQVVEGGLPKGDALQVARVAGIQAAKRTHELIPLCHPVAVTSVRVDFDTDAEAGTIAVHAEARTTDRTGVEMEALTAAAVAALTIYDMCKALQRDIEIRSVCLLRKEGGKSGTFVKKEKRGKTT